MKNRFTFIRCSPLQQEQDGRIAHKAALILGSTPVSVSKGFKLATLLCLFVAVLLVHHAACTYVQKCTQVSFNNDFIYD